MIYNELLEKKTKIAVVGLGYVGLPIALEFAKYINVIGFDINKERIEKMKQNIDPSKELESNMFENKNIEFTHQIEDLKDVKFFVIAVPTPIDESKMPDLRPLISATKSISKVLKKGDYVVYESTVYPGCTEEDCVPILEELTNLKINIDFKVGYSPERINPGDRERTIDKIVKITSGSDSESAEQIAKVYELIIKAGVHRASSIKVAEAAKIIENTQRDVNIALINELSIIFNKMNINTFDVLEAAGTKWNFLNFRPGIVGGHCIGVDPYYLTHKARQLGYHTKIINSGRYINDSMGFYIGKQTVKKILAKGKNIIDARVLIMGVTFKEDVSDIRNSRIIDIIKELESFSCKVDLVDPNADSEEFFQEYGYSLTSKLNDHYDAIIMAVNHKEYNNVELDFFTNLMDDNKGVFIDIKGIYKDTKLPFDYWSL